MTLGRGIAAAIAAAVLTACSAGADDDPAAFCTEMRRAVAATSAITSLDLDDAEVVNAAIADLESLQDAAPEAIAADVDAVAHTYGMVLELLAATAPGARSDALRGLQADLDEVAGAAATMQSYAEETCQLRFRPPPEPDPTPTPLDIVD